MSSALIIRARAGIETARLDPVHPPHQLRHAQTGVEPPRRHLGAVRELAGPRILCHQLARLGQRARLPRGAAAFGTFFFYVMVKAKLMRWRTARARSDRRVAPRARVRQDDVLETCVRSRSVLSNSLTPWISAVDCKLCHEPTKKHAVLCQDCGLIAHSRCSEWAPVPCEYVVHTEVVQFPLTQNAQSSLPTCQLLQHLPTALPTPRAPLPPSIRLDSPSAAPPPLFRHHQTPYPISRRLTQQRRVVRGPGGRRGESQRDQLAAQSQPGREDRQEEEPLEDGFPAPRG